MYFLRAPLESAASRNEFDACSNLRYATTASLGFAVALGNESDEK